MQQDREQINQLTQSRPLVDLIDVGVPSQGDGANDMVINEEFRLVSLNDQGQREVASGVVSEHIHDDNHDTADKSVKTPETSLLD
jgi:hypothetical protein